MRYDASCGEWLRLNPVPRKGTVGSSVAKLRDDIFLISGMMNVQGNTTEFTEEVFKYKIASNKWVKVANQSLTMKFFDLKKQQFLGHGLLLPEEISFHVTGTLLLPELL